MANARQAQLQNQRSTYGSYGSANKIRLLAPAQTGISSIAKQNAANETDIMVAKYNAGQVSNEEMKTFLQTQAASPYTSASDKVQIQTKLMDFDVLIEKDRLEAVFKSAPENTLQKEQAAQALAQFYTNRASTMVAGTQAHSQAIENAGIWQQNVQSIQQSVSKQQRKNLENSLLQKVNTKPTGSSERSTAQADMYKQLYDMAISQGDEEDAQVYAAKYEQAKTVAQQYGEQETAQTGREYRSELINEMNIAKNAFLTGQISKEDYYAVLEKANQYALDYQDGTLQNTITSNVTAAEKLMEKGGPNGKIAGGSLMAKVKSNGQGGAITGYDQKVYENSQQMREAQELLKNKKIDGARYNALIGSLIVDKNDLLQQQLAEFESVASENSNAKVYVDGSKIDVSKAIDAISKELQDVSVQADAVQSGEFALLFVEPKSDGEGAKSVATTKIINKNNIDNTMVADSEGNYHFIEYAQRPLTEYPFVPFGKTELEQQQSITQQINAALSAGGLYDANGNWIKVGRDKAGNPIFNDYDSKYVEISDPKTGEKNVERILNVGDKSFVRSLNQIQKEAEQTQDSVENPNDYTSVPLIPESTPVKPALQKIREAIPQVIESGKKVIQQGVDMVPDQVVDTVKTSPLEALSTALPKSTQAPVQQAIKTIQQSPIQALSNATINKPSTTPQSNSGSMPITKVINNVPSVKQYDVNTGFNYQPIKAPVVETPKPTTLQKIGTTISNVASQAVNKLKSLKWW